MKKDYKDILYIALPAMAENLLQMLMGTVDSYLVAFLGLVALSGVSVANNIMAIFQAIFIALAAAISSRMASEVGRGEEESVHRSALEAIKLTLCLGLVLGFISLFGHQVIFALLGTEEKVAQSGGLYLALVGGGVVLLGLMTSLGAILRATGRPRLPMYVSLLSNLLNILFSAIGVFVCGWGIAGVALGTLLSRLVACLILWQQATIPLSSFIWPLDRHLLSLVLPSTGERLMMRGGDVLVVALVTRLGTSVLAGNAIGETLTQFNYMPALGIATATVILTAKYQGDRQRLERVRRASLQLSLVCMLLVALTTYWFGPYLIGLFTQDPLAVEASQLVLLAALIGLPFTAGTLVYTAFWQGLGKPQLPFYATTIGMWVVRIVSAYLLLTYGGLGLAAIWIGTVLDNCFRFAYLAYVARKRMVDGV